MGHARKRMPESIRLPPARLCFCRGRINAPQHPLLQSFNGWNRLWFHRTEYVQIHEDTNLGEDIARQLRWKVPVSEPTLPLAEPHAIRHEAGMIRGAHISPDDSPQPKLLLVGGGHAHVAVLADWIRNGPPPPGGAARLRTLLLTPHPTLRYSGMVPAGSPGSTRATRGWSISPRWRHAPGQCGCRAAVWRSIRKRGWFTPKRARRSPSTLPRSTPEGWGAATQCSGMIRG